MENFLPYGIFVLCGIFGTFGSLALVKYGTIKNFLKHLFLTVILSTSFGIMINYYFEDLELSYGITLALACFMKNITNEIKEIIDYLDIFSKNKLDKNSQKDVNENSDETETNFKRRTKN